MESKNVYRASNCCKKGLFSKEISSGETVEQYFRDELASLERAHKAIEGMAEEGAQTGFEEDLRQVEEIVQTLELVKLSEEQ